MPLSLTHFFPSRTKTEGGHKEQTSRLKFGSLGNTAVKPDQSPKGIAAAVACARGRCALTCDSPPLSRAGEFPSLTRINRLTGTGERFVFCSSCSRVSTWLTSAHDRQGALNLTPKGCHNHFSALASLSTGLV